MRDEHREDVTETFGERAIELTDAVDDRVVVQRVTKLVIDDVREPPGVLALRVLAQEVDVVAVRERVATAALVDADRQRLTEPRETRVEPRLCKLLRVAREHERRHLRVAGLARRLRPRGVATGSQRERAGDSGA